MSKRKHREGETMSLSFLDVICCGFGAIILLLVITKVYEPIVLEENHAALELMIKKLEEELYDIKGDTQIVNRQLETIEPEVSEQEERVARLQGDLSRIRSRFTATRDDASVTAELEGSLAQARQALTEEMQRLLGQEYRRKIDDATVGGIPVDSEYIIFIIDTSGSMVNYSWGLVQDKLRETLDVYPTVKGIQVMNDMGEYMFSSYRGKWIPDGPTQRQQILRALSRWTPFSNSSPVEGITTAIRTYYAPDKKISLYVFGDEFTGPSIESVVRDVAKINKADDQGNRRVRIHAIGFPVVISAGRQFVYTGARFATLMRILCQRNGGTFVGLEDYR